MKRGMRLLNVKLGNRGQMKISFGMIFSIILIILFLGFAIYGIMKFLEISECAKIGKSVDGLRGDVDKMWKASQGSQEVVYNFPLDIEYVCFVDYESEGIGRNSEKFREMKRYYFGEPENLEFYPEKESHCLDSIEIEHIDIERITSKENPYCIPNENGKVSMILKKNFSENLVVVTR